MPIYEYKCNTCEEVFDQLVSRDTAGDLLKCPKCGSIGARRLVSAFAAHGLENGHIAVGRKFTGGANKPEPQESSQPAAAPAAPAAAAAAAAPAAQASSSTASAAKSA